jgi:hypothetical protein
VIEKTKPPRDWLAITISLFSLLISGLTIYFNVFLALDDLRVVVGPPPTIARDKTGEASIDGDQELTFCEFWKSGCCCNLCFCHG